MMTILRFVSLCLCLPVLRCDNNTETMLHKNTTQTMLLNNTTQTILNSKPESPHSNTTLQQPQPQPQPQSKWLQPVICEPHETVIAVDPTLHRYFPYHIKVGLRMLKSLFIIIIIYSCISESQAQLLRQNVFVWWQNSQRLACSQSKTKRKLIEMLNKFLCIYKIVFLD